MAGLMNTVKRLDKVELCSRLDQARDSLLAPLSAMTMETATAAYPQAYKHLCQ
jgi:hypothetical protein